MPIVRRIAFLLSAVTSLTAYDHSALADTGPCSSIEYERAKYAVCEVDLHKHTVRLYWNRSDGTPYGYLSSLPRSVEGGFPVTNTLMGLGSLPGVGPAVPRHAGDQGPTSSNLAMHGGHIMLAIGARFDDRVTGRLNAFSQGSRKIHIDIDPSSLNKSVPVELAIVSDAGQPSTRWSPRGRKTRRRSMRRR